MLTKKPKTKILVDGGDPGETLRVKNLVGFVDGQTTNPSLIAKNPEIQQRIASGHTLTAAEDKDNVGGSTGSKHDDDILRGLEERDERARRELRRLGAAHAEH